MKFICDSMVGRLAKWLRILGFDCLYCREGEKAELLRLTLREERIILTRDKSFVKGHPERSFLIKSESLETQLVEIMKRFRLQAKSSPFSRCSVCNDLLLPRTKSDVKGKVPFFVYQNHDRFAYCRICDKYYWEGTHHKAMQDKIARLIKRREG